VYVGTQVGHDLSLGCRQAAWSPSELARICRASDGKSAFWLVHGPRRAAVNLPG
jgi:hypothetical protein